MDFCRILTEPAGSAYKPKTNVYPSFRYDVKIQDLSIKGNSFEAFYDEDTGLWNKSRHELVRKIDQEIYKYVEENNIPNANIMDLGNGHRGMSTEFLRYIKEVGDTNIELDTKITFANTPFTREDHVSTVLPYAIAKGSTELWDELMGTLYDEWSRELLEWCIGAIISGESQNIQKFVVLYGPPGKGKSTFMNIVDDMFKGYTAAFDAESLGSSSNQFATAVFASNPLIAIQQDGDLSKIETNALLNSLVSHETIMINEKHKAAYPLKCRSMLFMGTNKPVRITDGKSGLLRRLLDVKPTGNVLSPNRYNYIMDNIKFEYGAIADKCLTLFKERGARYYNNYVPVEQQGATDPVYNFCCDNQFEFEKLGWIKLPQAYDMYCNYMESGGFSYKMNRLSFQNEFKNYWKDFRTETRIDGDHVRNVYVEFLSYKFNDRGLTYVDLDEAPKLSLTETKSRLDEEWANCKAQYSNAEGHPCKAWDKVTTSLKDIDTRLEHYVMVPDTKYIVLDFDLKNDDGTKSQEKNLMAAANFPTTYTEFSKSGSGVHMHYLYEGDVDELARTIDKDIEIKVYSGKSSLRRKLTYCNNESIRIITGGLPFKEVKKMIDTTGIKDAIHLRNCVRKALLKQVHPNTASNIDYIKMVTDKAYAAGFQYDLMNMYQDIVNFASNSTHQADRCLKTVASMHLQSENCYTESVPVIDSGREEIVYDIESLPDVFIVDYALANEEEDRVTKLINPSSQQISELFERYELIGFNNRAYDNHMLWAAHLGWSVESLNDLSQRLVGNFGKEAEKNSKFREAYGLSKYDLYDISSTKQSLKKWEIEMGIVHDEFEMAWDKPIGEKNWQRCADYCANDVIATKKLYHKMKDEIAARDALAVIAKGSTSDSTNTLTCKLIFGNDKNPQSKFVYTDLSEEFPGYKFENGKSSYMDVEEIGEGGYVYANPGYYENVTTFDVTSMHPHSIKALNLFGDEYTKRFYELVEGRVAVKKNDVEKLKTVLGGELAQYADADEATRKNIAQALKQAINSVYGLTSAKFPNPCRDPRNVDNIVAKRGALFMITLRNKVEEMGYTVVHVKTDSIKVVNADERITNFIMEFGKKYGYGFEVEDVFEKICLVNKAVYISRLRPDDPEWLFECREAEKKGLPTPTRWHATGAQFKHDYVFKTLFSHEPLVFNDMTEVKSVKGTMYIDNGNELRHIGKVGRFCPMLPDTIGAGKLVVKRTAPDGTDKYDSVTGAKDYVWMESSTVESLGLQNQIDMRYFQSLNDVAITTLGEFVDYDTLVAGE